jgi:heme oxygenase
MATSAPFVTAGKILGTAVIFRDARHTEYTANQPAPAD